MITDGWAPVLDKLLLGVTHNISNRVATLAGVSEILSGEPTIPPILRALTDEVPRLEEAIRLLRLLAAPEDQGEEALEMTRIVDDAISLSQLHPACRNVSFEIEGRRDVPPVIARPTLLTHEIVVALVTAATDLITSNDAASGVVEPVRIPIIFVAEQHELIMSAGTATVRARQLTAGRR